MRTKAGIPLGPVGAIFGEVILCCDDDNDGLRLRSFLCIVERVRSDLGIRVGMNVFKFMRDAKRQEVGVGRKRLYI